MIHTSIGCQHPDHGHHASTTPFFLLRTVAVNRVTSTVLLLTAVLTGSVCAQSLDETWTVTIGNQTVYANPDGSFFVPSITVLDNNNDMQSDELIRVFAVGRKSDGSRQYAASTHFRLVQGETYFVDSLEFSDIPPIGFVQSVRVEGSSQLTVGDMTPLSTFIALQTGDEEPAQTAAQGTTYRSSSPTIVSVDENGLLEALAPGNASIIAMNGGAAGIRSVRVMGVQTSTTMQGFVQLSDGASAPGASVQLTDGSSTVADMIGRFELQVTSSRLLETIQATTSFSDGMDEYVGRSASLPVVPDGLTDVGIIVLEPKQPPPLFDHATLEISRLGTPRPVVDVELGDVNGDNIRDVIVLGGTWSSLLPALHILTADNGGRLTESYFGAGATSSITVTDFDLDGDRDVVSHDRRWENQGNGTWVRVSAPIEGLDPLHQYQFVESGDLDGDGFPEIVFATTRSTNQPKVVAVARNDNGQGYVDPIEYELPGTTLRGMDDLGLADLNGDRNLDVVAYFGVSSTPELRIGFNDGGGALTWADPVQLNAPLGLRSNAFLEDANNDGHLDLVTSSHEDSQRAHLVSFLNIGDGLTLSEVPSFVDVLHPLASGDFDRDGNVDVIGSKLWNINRSNFLSESTLAYGDGLGLFLGQVSLGMHYYNFGGESGDVDGDGFLDVALWNLSHVGILQNVRQGEMRTEQVLDANVAADEMVVADMDGNGGDDLVILSNSPRSVVVATNNGDGTLTFGPTTSVGGTQLSELCVVDLTGNSMLDAVLLKRTSSPTALSIEFLQNDGSGNLLHVSSMPIVEPFISPDGLSVANLDQDPAYELIVIDRGIVRVYKQTDDFDFQEVQISLAPNIVGPVRHGDFDGDGDTDLATGRLGGMVVLLAQTSPLNFEEVDQVGPTTLLSEFEAGFINADMFSDLVVAEPGTPDDPGNIIIHHGSPSGFVPGATIEAEVLAGQDTLCLADLDLDGALDITAATGSTLFAFIGRTGIAVITNTSDGGGFTKQDYGGSFRHGAQPTTWDIVAIDLDLDGDLDIIQSDTRSRLFLIHENRTR